MKKKLFVIISIMTITLGITACQKKEESTAITESVIESETYSASLGTIASEEEKYEKEQEEELQQLVESSHEAAKDGEPETIAPEDVVDEAYEQPEEEETADFTVEAMSATMYASQNCNVRSGPSTDYERVGALNYSDAVTVTGKVNEANWYEIQLADGTKAYVSASLLQAEKPVAQSSTTTAPSTNTQTPSSTTTAPSTNTQTPSNNDAGNSSTTGGANLGINPATGQPYKEGDKTPDGLTVHIADDWF